MILKFLLAVISLGVVDRGFLFPATEQDAWVLPKEPQEESTLEEVVVTAFREQRAVQFVDALTRPARGGAVDGQMARWSEPLCLHVMGDAPSTAVGGTLVSHSSLRLGVVNAVRSVGVPALETNCQPNAIIVISNSSDAFATTMVQRYRHRLFDNQSEDIAAFQGTDAAARWWHGTRTGGAARPDIEAGSFAAASAAQGELPNSRLRLGTAQNIVRAMVVLDRERWDEIDLNAMFDYLAFVLLIDLPRVMDITGLSTVLNLAKEGDASSGFTVWDRAFIRGVYRASPGQRLGQQRREVSAFMRDALANESTSP